MAGLVGGLNDDQCHQGGSCLFFRTFPLQASSLDVGLPDGLDDDGYLGAVADVLPRVLAQFKPDLVLYDAGVDVHVDDALGRYVCSSHALAHFKSDLVLYDDGRDVHIDGALGCYVFLCTHDHATRPAPAWHKMHDHATTRARTQCIQTHTHIPYKHSI